jgi:cytosine permease
VAETEFNKNKNTRGTHEVIEDYALAKVPESQMKSGWKLAWPSMGIATTLVQILIGYDVSAIAGMKFAIIADVLVAIFGGTLGWFVSIVSHKAKLSSTVTSRFYGLGARGSVISSGIFGFMILGFLALENALLYYGTIFALGWNNSLFHAAIILAILTVVWILLTTYGINQILKVSTYFLVAFFVLLAYMFYKVGFASGVSFSSIMTHGPLIPGIGSTMFRFATAITILAGSAGALALVDADYARYAKTSRDIPKMTYLGSIALDIVTMIVGSVIIYGGFGSVSSYLLSHGLATSSNVSSAVINLASNNSGAFFIVLSTFVGFALMYAAQVKAQVLNTYSGSLALSNFVDVFAKKRPGRFFMVIAGNIIALIMIAVGILSLIVSWLTILGIITTSFATLMIADYFIVRKGVPVHENAPVETVNIAGVVTIVFSSALAYTLEYYGIFILGFLLTLIIVLVLYPILRIFVFKQGKFVKEVAGQLAIKEES